MKRSLLLFLFLFAGIAHAELKTHFADGLYGRKMYDMALGEYEKLLAQVTTNSPHSTLLFRAGECARELGRWPDAEAYYTQALNAHGDALFARRSRIRLGQRAIANAQFQAARDILAPKYFTEVDEISAAGQYYYFETYLKPKQWGGALKSADALSLNFPESVYLAHAVLHLCESGGVEAKALVPLLDRAVMVSAADTAIRSRLSLLRAENLEKLQSFDKSRAAYVQLLADFPESTDAQEARLKAGWLYLKTKDFRHLLPMIQQLPAEEKKANEAAWVYLEANAYREIGNEKRAQQLYGEMTKDWADSSYAPYAAYEWAVMLFNTERFAEVVELGSLMLKANDQMANVLWLLGEASAEQSLWVKATEYFNVLGELKEGGAKARSAYGLAQLLYIQELWPEAGDAFKAYSKGYNGSENAPAALIKAGQAYYNAGLSEPAVDSWTALIEQYPKHKLAPDATKQAALLQLDLKQYDAAQTLFEKLKQQHHERYAIQATYWLGVLAQQDDSRGDAIALPLLKEAVSQELDSLIASRAAYRLGLIYFKQEQHDDAEGMLLQALKEHWTEALSSSYVIWFMERQLDKGETARCIHAGDRLLKQVQIAPEALARATHAMGSAYLMDGAQGEALRFFQLAAQAGATGRLVVDAQLKAANLCLNAGRVAEAQQQFERAGASASEGNFLDLQALSYYGLGELAEQDERWEDAARYFMGVAILFDDAELSPDSLQRAAQAFEKQGKHSESEQALKELKERYPEIEVSER